MVTHKVGILFGGVLLVVLAVLSISWSASRGVTILETWAQANDFKILSQEECWFFKGLFFWNSSRSQKIYRVTVRDSQAHVRSGYVCCGGFWLGMWSDQIEVRWDE